MTGVDGRGGGPPGGGRGAPGEAGGGARDDAGGDTTTSVARAEYERDAALASRDQAIKERNQDRIALAAVRRTALMDTNRLEEDAAGLRGELDTKGARVAALEGEVRAAQEEAAGLRDTLEGERDVAVRRASALEGERNVAVERAGALESERNVAVRRADATEQGIEGRRLMMSGMTDLRNQLLDEQGKLAGVRTELAVERTTSSARETERLRLLTEQESMRIDIVDTQGRLAGVRADLRRSLTEQKAMTIDLSVKTEAVGKFARVAIDMEKATVARLEHECDKAIAALAVARDKHEGERNVAVERTGALEGERDVAVERAIALEGERDVAVERAIALESERDVAVERAIALDMELSALRKDRETIDAERRRLREVLNNTRTSARDQLVAAKRKQRRRTVWGRRCEHRSTRHCATERDTRASTGSHARRWTIRSTGWMPLKRKYHSSDWMCEQHSPTRNVQSFAPPFSTDRCWTMQSRGSIKC